MQANCNKEALFPDDAFQLIFEKTLGVPRKINIFVDRLLLFGFLEELTKIDCDVINEVAEEMSVELTGSLTNEEQALLANSTTVESHTTDNIKHILREVEEILEGSIQQKVKMTRYVDKILKQKSRALAELQSKEAK